jgi:vitamin-K-epoxide reductase (warfarin-sensitive)
LRYLLVVLALAGLVVSVLALHVHYSSDLQPCDINAHWDCGIVNHSRYAEFHHVPVAIFGIVGYGLLAVLSFLKKFRLTLLCALAGFCYALYLTRIEAHVLQVWCLYCVISQTLIALLLLLSIVAVAQSWRQAADA